MAGGSPPLQLGFRLTAEPKYPFASSLRLQLERVALSVSNNIAEGVERLTANELRNYLVIARGSAGEVRSMMAVVRTEPNFGRIRLVSQKYAALAENCGRELGAWLRTLREPGQRATGSPRNGPAGKTRFKPQPDGANLRDSMPPG